MRTGLLTIHVLALAACAAQPKPIAYSVTVVSATLPSEKAPGVTWDEPGQDETAFADGCNAVAPYASAAAGAATGAAVGSVVPGLGTAIGAVAGGIIGIFAKKGCDSFVVKADPSVPLPDPLIKLDVGDVVAAPPPQQNTANPIWNQEFEFPYEKRMKILVFIFDVDGDDGEPMGSCVLKPKKVKDTVELKCGDGTVLFAVEPVYPEKGDDGRPEPERFSGDR